MDKTLKPWGYEQIIYLGTMWTVKLLHIKPGCRLSEQYHNKKWECIYYPTGATKEIPPTTIHRLENPTKEPIELLEVSLSGLENDIVRLQDDYCRK